MARSFHRLRDIFGFLNRGKFEEQVDKAFVHAIETLQALPDNRPGKATITLTIDIAHDSGRLDFKPAIKTKLPDGEKFSSTPFWAVDGGVSIEHPSQHDMFGGPHGGPRIVPSPVPTPNEPRDFG